MRSKVLLAWIGNTDLKAEEGAASAGVGPIAQAVAAQKYDRVVLLSNFPGEASSRYKAWLKKQTGTAAEIKACRLSGPTNFGEIYEAVVGVLEELSAKSSGEAEFTFHLSPGTPAMASVWIILAKTRYPATLIESSREHGVKVAAVPFDISAEYLPNLLRRPDEALIRLSQGLPAEAPEFEAIVHRSAVMKDVIARARRVAVRTLPVLIEGESGTGKELLARAIHRSSPRRDGPFIAVNCGAIPAELVESEFFGHKKGSFTGAVSDRKGHFERADGGSIFLDEIGELPKAIQVKLLRTLQEGEVTPIGSSEPRKIDVRVIAATNRILIEEVAAGNFREDLFYRLAVAIIKLPPLRARAGDISLLIETLLEQVNDAAKDLGIKHKKLSASAKNIMLQHAWPGNVRELLNTLQRAAVWSDDEVIGVEAIKDAIQQSPRTVPGADNILNRPVDAGIELESLMAQVARHYIERALENTRNNKTQAAKLLGFGNYQTFTNWMNRYGVTG